MTNYKCDQMRKGQIYGWHVYLVGEGRSAKYCKIGSASTVEWRLTSLQTGNPRKLRIIKSWHLDSREDARRVESAALDHCAERRIPKSEWVKCSPEYAINIIEAAICRLDASLRTSAEPRWQTNSPAHEGV